MTKALGLPAPPARGPNPAEGAAGNL